MIQRAENGAREAAKDQVLFKEIDNFGKFQLKVIALCSLVTLFYGLDVNIYIFTFASVKTRCFIQECDNSTSQIFSAPWILQAIPADRDTFDNCRRYATIPESLNACSKEAFNRNSTIECNKYLYEHTNSAVFEYNLACDDWRPNLAGSIVSFGHMLALPLGGFVADRWGRRVALTLSAFNLAWIGSMLYFANTYICYVLVAFMSALFGSSCADNALILAIENVAPKHRVAVTTFVTSFVALGRMLLGLITWTNPSWRHLILIVHVPALITFLYFWMVPESIRWLISKNRHEEAAAILEEIAKINGNTLTTATLPNLEDSDIGQKRKIERELWIVHVVFQHKPILLRCLVTPIWWISTYFVFSGLTLSSVSLSGNPSVNYSLVSAVAIPGFWLAVISLGKIGRKGSLMAAFWICGVCQLTYILIPKGKYWLSLITYLTSKLSASVVMATIAVYTAELYPTPYRASLFAFSATCGSIGSALAPLVLSLAVSTWDHLPFAFFGGMAFFSGFLVLLTPETFGCPLPDTMEEAVNIGKVHQKTLAKTLQPLIELKEVAKNHSG